MKGEDTSKSGIANDYWKKQFADFLTSLKSADATNPMQMMDGSNGSLNKLRKELVEALQELLLGDELAAEYLLMHLLSSV
jgi:hypothetical protein